MYESDLDTNGAIYFLGNRVCVVKQAVESDSFANPHVNNLVTVRMSSILIGEPANLVSRMNIPTCTRYKHHLTLEMKTMPGSALISE